VKPATLTTISAPPPPPTSGSPHDVLHLAITDGTFGQRGCPTELPVLEANRPDSTSGRKISGQIPEQHDDRPCEQAACLR